MAIIKNPGVSIKPITIDNPKIDEGFLRYNALTDSYQTILPEDQVSALSNNMISSSAVYNYLAGGIPYLTTAPTADNTSGRMLFVVLYESQKASTTQYEGYWYIFVQDPPTP